jgi:hypothetical protein
MTAPADLIHLKAVLALTGLRLDPSAQALAHGNAEAIDLELPSRLPVSVPVLRAVEATPYVLTVRAGQSFVEAPERVPPVPVRATRAPRFYERTTSQGTPMGRVARLHGRLLVVAPGGACGFGVRGSPCPFCLEGARADATRGTRPSTNDVIEVVQAALAEGTADVVYFNSCAFDADDGGIAFLAPYIQAVRRHVDALIAVQVHPPATRDWVARTYAMGVDAVSYNLEIFDPDVLMKQCVGRARYIGRARYLDVLEHAARIFPSGAVWTELVAGLEPRESTMAGIDALVGIGVLPVLVLNRLAVRPGANGRLLDDVDALVAHLFDAVRRGGINMGWVHGLPLGIAPLDAGRTRHEVPRLAAAIGRLRRARVGALAIRNLARVRRRLRVRTDEADAAHGKHA